MIEFLHTVVSTLEDYFSECSESLIKENYVVVYEVSVSMMGSSLLFIAISFK